jgi:hypothetical protein
MIEVIIHTNRGYRFLIDTKDRDVAIERAQEQFVNEGSDGIEGGYENVVDIEANEMDE